MEAKAQVRYLRMSPMKARRVVDLIRGKRTGEALDVLRFAPQAASEPVSKLVESAIANARIKADQQGERFDPRDLVVAAAYVVLGVWAGARFALLGVALGAVVVAGWFVAPSWLFLCLGLGGGGTLLAGGLWLRRA